MKGLNAVTLGGNLTRDAVLKTTDGGFSILEFGVAVNESRKNQRTGEWDEYPNYVDCKVLGKRAESLERFLSRGTYVALTGRLHQSRWQNKDGQNRSRLEVVVDEIHFETRSDDSDEYDQQQAEGYADSVAQDMYDEDIPF